MTLSTQQQPDVPVIPGSRIGGYRNSHPRHIRLYGLGAVGATIVREIGRTGRPNVAVRSGSSPVGWAQVAGDMPDPNTNMIIIVCGEGDEILFDADGNKPASLVTFVLLQSARNVLVVGGKGLVRARGQSDLFVTTSDVDYVADLIDNLAS